MPVHVRTYYIKERIIKKKKERVTPVDAVVTAAPVL